MFVLMLYLLTLQSKGELETGEWGGGGGSMVRSTVNSERVNSQLFYPFHEQFK